MEWVFLSGRRDWFGPAPHPSHKHFSVLLDNKESPGPLEGRRFVSSHEGTFKTVNKHREPQSPAT